MKLASDGERLLQDLFGSVYHAPVIRSLLCSQLKMSLCVFKHLMVRMNVSHPLYYWYSLVTCVFSSSGVFAALIIAMLFCWHTQHKSDIGFITMICGTSCRQRVQKVLYAAALTSASSAESLYSTHTAYYVQVHM